MSKITKELLKKIFPNTKAYLRDRFVTPLNEILPKYGISTKKQFAAFIANVGIESDRLKTTKEYGADSYFTRYNNRKDLGNVRSGDGPRYKGRSVLQTTGRYNYWRVTVAYLKVLTGKNWDSSAARNDFDKYLKSKEYSDLLVEADKYNVNFLAKPELLEEFPHAVEAAGVFVKDNNLNKYADKGKEGFYAYAGVLNTGSARKKANHYNERLDIYEKALEVIPEDFNLGVAKPVTLAAVPEVIAESSDGAVNVSQTSSEKTEDGIVSQTIETKNEQDVNTVAEVKEPEPYNKVGLMSTLKTDLLAVFGGNLGFEGISQFITQASGLPEWLIKVLVPIFTFISIALVVGGVIWLGFRFVHYVMYKLDVKHKRELETTLNADPTKKDVTFV